MIYWACYDWLSASPAGCRTALAAYAWFSKKAARAGGSRSISALATHLGTSWCSAHSHRNSKPSGGAPAPALARMLPRGALPHQALRAMVERRQLPQ